MPKRNSAMRAVPDYFAAALQRNEKVRAAFENSSPSHQREYPERIAEAKREGTRARRIAQAIGRLAGGRKPD